MPKKTEDPIDQLRAVVARGQAAQRAVDQVLAEHAAKEFPPWRRCAAVVLPFCPGWTRGLYCPQHRGATEAAGEDRGRPAGRGNLHPARPAAIQGVTGPAASGGQNAPKPRRGAT